MRSVEYTPLTLDHSELAMVSSKRYLSASRTAVSSSALPSRSKKGRRERGVVFSQKRSRYRRVKRRVALQGRAFFRILSSIRLTCFSSPIPPLAEMFRATWVGMKAEQQWR